MFSDACGSRGLFQYLTDLSLKYGAAWIVVTQTLAWMTFFGIYAMLRYTDFDVTALLKSWGFGPDILSLAEAGGIWALTFALNRALMPVRLGLSILLMPLLAGPLNAVLDPWVAQFTKTSGPPAQGTESVSAPAAAAAEEKKKTK